MPLSVELPGSARLVLRRFDASDLEAMVAYRSAPEVARYQGWSSDWSAVDAASFLEADRKTSVGARGEWTQVALELRETGELCGDLAVHFWADQPRTVELGATIAPAHQRRGLATEALVTMTSWLFAEHEAHRILANVDERNVGMRRVFERMGLRQEAELRDADWFKDEWTTLCTYAALASEWGSWQRD